MKTKKIIFFIATIFIIVGLIFLVSPLFNKEHEINFSTPVSRSHLNKSDLRMTAWELENGTIINETIEIKSSEFEISLSSFIVGSGSMQPSIPIGSKIITRKPTNDSDFYIGDIVCYESNHNIAGRICHRIINISEDRQMFLAKGDANKNPDGWYNKDLIKEIIVGVIY